MARLTLVISFLCVAWLTAVDGGEHRPASADTIHVTLNKHQLAALAVAIKEMQRRGWPFRDYQVVVADEGSNYSVAFMEDPVRDIGGGQGCSWDIRKHDMKIVGGPWFYR